MFGSHEVLDQSRNEQLGKKKKPSWETELLKVDLLSGFKDNWETSGLIYLKHNYD